MSRTPESTCPHCGRPPPGPRHAPAPPAPVERYDLEALAAEAAADAIHDESAKVRVTQQDIRKLLDKRRKERTRK